MHNLEYLKNFILFSELEDEDLIKISKLLERKKYPPGATIFMEGDEGNKVFFIRKGKIKAIKMSMDGNEQILDIMQPGEVFGEVVLFGVERYPASAIALEELEVDYLTREKFREFFKDNPEIGWGMLKVMARKLFRSQHKVGNLGLRDTKGRVATLIIDMLHDFGDSKKEVELDLNRREMANLIGTSRETVSRTLSEFKKDGLVEFKGKKLVVKDLEGLKKWTY